MRGTCTLYATRRVSISSWLPPSCSAIHQTDMGSEDEYEDSDLSNLSPDDLASIDAKAAAFYAEHPEVLTQRKTPVPIGVHKPGPSTPTALGKRKNAGVDDMDLLPDITVIDGGYALGAPEVKRSRPSPQQARPRNAALTEAARRQREADIEEALRQRDRMQHRKLAPRRQTPVPRRPQLQRQPSKPIIPLRGPTAPPSSQDGNRVRGVSPMHIQRPRGVSPLAIRGGSPIPTHRPHAPPQPPPNAPSRSPTPAPHSPAISDVQQQLDAMRAELASVRLLYSSLMSALDALNSSRKRVVRRKPHSRLRRTRGGRRTAR